MSFVFAMKCPVIPIVTRNMRPFPGTAWFSPCCTFICHPLSPALAYNVKAESFSFLYVSYRILFVFIKVNKIVIFRYVWHFRILFFSWALINILNNSHSLDANLIKWSEIN